MFGELLSGLGDGLLTIAKTSAPLILPGLLAKHATKIPNESIPYVNGVIGVGLGWAMTGDPQQGAQLGIMGATGSVGLHQMLKMGARKWLKVESL